MVPRRPQAPKVPKAPEVRKATEGTFAVDYSVDDVGGPGHGMMLVSLLGACVVIF